MLADATWAGDVAELTEALAYAALPLEQSPLFPVAAPPEELRLARLFPLAEAGIGGGLPEIAEPVVSV